MGQIRANFFEESDFHSVHSRQAMPTVLRNQALKGFYIASILDICK